MDKNVYDQRLKITEIFYSIQGESSFVGWPTVFIRLTGCPLRCQYCDTAYAFTGGEWLTIESIVQQVQNYQTRYITVTGGEPLAQKRCLKLLTQLCDLDYVVSLETSGAIDISEVDPRVHRIMDIKTPGSREEDKNLWANLDHLAVNDQLKFVICDHEDYLWAKQLIDEYQLTQKCGVLFSPSYEQITSKELAEWILADQLPVRYQLQLHKSIWGDEPGK